MDNRTCPHGRAQHDDAWKKGFCNVCMKDEIDTLRTQLADAVAFVRKVGHLPECPARGCATCGYTKAGCGFYEARISHNFQPGKCTCGHDDLLIYTQSSPYLVIFEQINTLLATHGAAALPEIALIVHTALKK